MLTRHHLPSPLEGEGGGGGPKASDGPHAKRADGVCRGAPAWAPFLWAMMSGEGDHMGSPLQQIAIPSDGPHVQRDWVHRGLRVAAFPRPLWAGAGGGVSRRRRK